MKKKVGLDLDQMFEPRYDSIIIELYGNVVRFVDRTDERKC